MSRVTPTLVTSLQAVAGRVGDRRGLRYYDAPEHSTFVGYRELDQRARIMADGLRRAGYAPGQRVLIGLNPGAQWIEAVYGALYAGLVFVPLPIPGTGAVDGLSEKVESIALASDAALMITDPEVLAALGEDGFTSAICDIVDVDALRRSGVEEEWVDPGVDGDAVALMLFTSGSTGEPKGVMASHLSIVTAAEIAGGALGFSDRTVFVGWLPLFHSMGLTLQWFTPAVWGADIVLTPTAQFQRRPLLWLRLLDRHRATATAAGNFAFAVAAQFADEATVAELDLTSLEVMVSAGEPVRSEVVRAFMEKLGPAGVRAEAIIPAIGMTETMLYCAKPPAEELRTPRFDAAALEAGRLIPPADGQVTELTSCGRPFAGVSVQIVDPLDSVTLPEGDIGEIWVSTPASSTGYFRQPDITGTVFGQELRGDSRSYLRTGDLGAMIDGELFVTGRLKDLIIIRGRNIYPQDLEAAALTVSPALGVSTAFELAGHPAPVGIVAEVDTEALCEDGRTTAELAQDLRAALVSRFSLPSLAVCLVPVGALPKTATGKIQRRPTRTRLEAGGFDPLYATGFGPIVMPTT